MVSARSPRTGPRLSVVGTNSVILGSQAKVRPEAGDASGSNTDWVARAEFSGVKPLLRKLSAPKWPECPFCWRVRPPLNVPGSRQMSLSLVPVGQRL